MEQAEWNIWTYFIVFTSTVSSELQGSLKELSTTWSVGFNIYIILNDTETAMIAKSAYV